MKNLIVPILALSMLGFSGYTLSKQIIKNREAEELRRKLDGPIYSLGDCVVSKQDPDREEWQQDKPRFYEMIVQVGNQNYRTLGIFSDSEVILDKTELFSWLNRFYVKADCPKIFQAASEALKSEKPNVRIEYGYGSVKVSHD
jgi:hypothetical protein